jgi:predicted dehydrogenase
VKESVGVGVIGVGVFGSQHARVWSELPGARLVAVADIIPERAEAAGRRFGCAPFTDMRELLRLDTIDVVSVCTPDDLHRAPVLAALEAGKHVIVEKPFAMTVEDCDAMSAAATRARRVLTVGHILRFDPRYHLARQAIARGDVGELVHMSARRRNQVGAIDRLLGHTSVLFFLGAHELDFLSWCAGSRIARVSCESVRKVLADRGADDGFLAVLRYENGVIASLEASWVLPAGYVKLEAGAELVCAKGTVFVDGGANGLRIGTSGPVTNPDVVYAPEVAGESSGALRRELSHFLDCTRDGRPTLVTPAEARHVVEGLVAMARSVETGASVVLSAR